MNRNLAAVIALCLFSSSPSFGEGSLGRRRGFPQPSTQPPSQTVPTAPKKETDPKIIITKLIQVGMAIDEYERELKKPTGKAGAQKQYDQMVQKTTALLGRNPFASMQFSNASQFSEAKYPLEQEMDTMFKEAKQKLGATFNVDPEVAKISTRARSLGVDKNLIVQNTISDLNVLASSGDVTAFRALLKDATALLDLLEQKCPQGPALHYAPPFVPPGHRPSGGRPVAP